MLITLFAVVALAAIAFYALLSQRPSVAATSVPASYLEQLRSYDIPGLLAFHKKAFGGAVMEILFDATVTPDDLTVFTRAVPQSDAFILDQILPNRYLDKNEVDFAELTQTNRTARFRAYDGRLHVSSRDAGSSKRVPLPPLSSSLSKGEYERLQMEFARTGGTNTAALAAAIYNDAEQLTREVLNRMELARGDALSDFKVTFLADNGEPLLEADFGAPAGHTVAPSVLWTSATLATMTPLQNMIDWRDVYIASRGSGPGQLLMSTTRASLIQRSSEIINAVHGSAAGRTRVTRAELNELLQSEGLPAVRTYDANVDVDGTTTRIIADDKVMFVPENPGELGYTAWGVSATALELINSTQSDLSFEDAPGIVGLVEKAGPPYREFTFVDAVGLPVISNPRALLVADVA